MEVTLPSGASVTYRDKLTANDKFAVQAAIRLSLDTTTGLQESSGSLVNDMRNALLKQVIEAWTFPYPLPHMGVGNPLGELDLDDYNALSDEVEPMLQRVVASPNQPGRSSS